MSSSDVKPFRSISAPSGSSSTTPSSLHDIIRIVELIKAELRCGICCSTVSSPVITSCNHIFCKNCFNECIRRLSSLICPMCKSKLHRRSCTECDSYEALVNHYLQLARAFKRDLTPMQLLPNENFLESQAPVNMAAAPSPIRSFQKPAGFAVPFGRPKGRKRSAPSTVERAAKRTAKMATVAEMEEPSAVESPPTRRVKQELILQEAIEQALPPTAEAPSLTASQAFLLNPKVEMLLDFVEETVAATPPTVHATPTSSQPQPAALVPYSQSTTTPSTTRENSLDRRPEQADKEVQAEQELPEKETSSAQTDAGILKTLTEEITENKEDESSSDLSILLRIRPELRDILLNSREEVLALVIGERHEKEVQTESLPESPEKKREEPEEEEDEVIVAQEQEEKEKEVEEDENEIVVDDPDSTAAFLDEDVPADHPLRAGRPSPQRVDTPVHSIGPSDETVLATPSSKASSRSEEFNFASPVEDAERGEEKENEEMAESDSFNDTLVMVDNTPPKQENTPLAQQSPSKVSSLHSSPLKSPAKQRLFSRTKSNKSDLVISDSDETQTGLVIAVAGVSSRQDEELITDFRALFGRASYVENPEDGATVLVCLDSNKRGVVGGSSLKMAAAHSCRIPLLTREWMLGCIRNKSILDSSSYYVRSAAVDVPPAWQRARIAMPPLLHGYYFFLPKIFSESQALPIDRLSVLIGKAGGTAVTRPWLLPKAKTPLSNPITVHTHESFILFAPGSTKRDEAKIFEGDCSAPVFTADWLIDSLCSYELIIKNTEKYRVVLK